ncbi:Z1 domain-containing protein [Staphylococcus pseudintermedius]|nr:Z1 domain-containing protein [Staphylococcus pseudintermedius]
MNEETRSNVKSQINNIKKRGYSWTEIRNIDFLDLSKEHYLENVLSQSILAETPISSNEWDMIVNEMEEIERKVELRKLSDRVKSNFKLPTDPYSAWMLYKENLKNKGFSIKSIERIEQSSIDILSGLSTNTVKDGPIKGLVVGNVQSGKTANMAAVMAMAADNGFNYFIVLSGLIENLRQQTANRLFQDLNTYGYGRWHWRKIDNPTIKSNDSEMNMSQYNLSSNSKDKFFTVCLKNKSRLNELKKWLLFDKNKAKQLKILIIDDEADQASINTKDVQSNEYTTINGIIRKLVNNNIFEGMNYISYTATPYANVLNETGKNSLYPKNFIAILEDSEDYIGPTQLFGTEEPERSPALDIVIQINNRDADIVKQIQNGESGEPLPLSFKASIHWFLITVVALRSLKYRKPISMLVHTSFKIDHHSVIADKIRKYLFYMKSNFNDIEPLMKDLYLNEKKSLTIERFKETMVNYSTMDDITDYPTWSEILSELHEFMQLNDGTFISHINLSEDGVPMYHNGIHLAIDNSKSKTKDQHVRLLYPEEKEMPEKAPAFIVVGGNTLSRGLTIEGLTSTYFLRVTNQADTLMQMGRWFGYRKGYELFPRVWMDELAQEKFTFMSQMNEELREEIRMYAQNKMTPIEYQPRIKNSPNFRLIKITASNKMQSAIPDSYDFTGFNSQTIYFENNIKILKDNLLVTESFLNALPKPEIKKSKMIWRNIPSYLVNKFLEKYHVCEQDIKMSTIPLLIEWFEKNTGEFDGWNIILSSVGRIEDTKNINCDWSIHGFSPKKVNRSKLNDRSDNMLASIGALRSPSDLLADVEGENINYNISKISEVMEIRNKNGLSRTPQLVIYRINKDSKPTNISSNGRVPLNFDEDIIGINLMIPSAPSKNKKNFETYIKAKIDPAIRNIDEDQFIDKEECENED